MTFFYDQQPGLRRAIGAVLRSREAELVAGIPHQGESSEDYHNSVYLISPDAEVVARYDKQYLLPFAEYLPLPGDWFRKPFERFREFQFGGPARLLPTRAGPAGILVCNEAVLPEIARQRVRQGAVYLVNPSNDSWSRDPQFTGQWSDIISFRAIEQRRYLVRASTSGPSAIIDPWGRVLASTESYERGVTSGRIEPRTELSVYGRVGDLFGWLCVASTLAALLGRRRAP